MQTNRRKHVRTFLIGYRSGGTPCISGSIGVCQDLVDRGTGTSQRPGSLPALRVACRYSPVGFDRQQYLTHVRKPALAESRLRSHQARSGGKPTPVAPSPLRRKAPSGRTSQLWWLSPMLSRLRSHPRLYISVSPTLRGPAGNKTFFLCN